MKTKAIIQWVSGECPETSSLKLMAIRDDGGILIQTGSFYADEEASAPCWHFQNGEVVPIESVDVLAWADLPVFDGPVEQAETDGKTFCEALDAIKVGIRVRRHDWPLGSYLWLLPAASVKAEWCREPHLKQLAERNGGSIEALASIRLYQFGQVLTGWNPTTEDLFATNWMILD